MIVGNQNPLHRRAPDPRARGMALSLAVLLLTLVMTLPHAPARAAGGDPLVLNGPASMEVLGRHLEYTTDPDWQLKVTDFIAPSAVALKPLPGPVPDFGYTPARIWLKLDVVNRTARTDEWRFFFHTNFTQQIAVYRIGAKAEAATLLKLTEDSPFSARPIDNPQVVAPFGLARGEAATLIVSYYSQGASRLSMSVETPQSFDAQTLANNAKSYAFYGMMLVMIALAAVALAALRQPVFAAYTGYLISVLMYVAHADGAAFQYVWPDFPRFNSMASVVGGSGVMVFGGLFAITFLQTARYHGVMHRVLQAVVAAVVAIDVVLWATDPQLLKRLLVVMISVSALSYLTAGIVAAWTRFREVRFYLFAWIAGIIPALLITLRYGFGFEPAIITTYDSVRLALLFDALMMGLALFDSYNHLRRTATEETLAHAQRNAALGQRLATLEQRYAQVSAQALEREESVKDTVHDLRQPMHALRLSLRQMFSADAQKATDVGQIESAEQALLRNQRLERDLASAEGSGLGLAVASEIADANGWAITACAGRKTGASIRVDLPARSDGQLRRLELAAGGEDVAAARRADRRGIAGIVDEVGELLDRLPVRALVVRARPGVERDQVDLGRNALEQLHQRAGIVELSLTSFSITYSKVMRRAFDRPGYCGRHRSTGRADTSC
jgi:signal transduction histidine kinase